MSNWLLSGSVPAFYRDVYEIVCPNQEHVDHDVFLKLLVKASLPKNTLSQVRTLTFSVLLCIAWKPMKETTPAILKRKVSLTIIVVISHKSNL